MSDVKRNGFRTRLRSAAGIALAVTAFALASLARRDRAPDASNDPASDPAPASESVRASSALIDMMPAREFAPAPAPSASSSGSPVRVAARPSPPVASSDAAPPVDPELAGLVQEMGPQLDERRRQEVASLIEEKTRVAAGGNDPATATRLRELESRLGSLDSTVQQTVAEVEAERSRREASARQTVEVGTLMRDGETLARAGRYDEATVNMDMILRLDPGNNMAEVRRRAFQDIRDGSTSAGAALGPAQPRSRELARAMTPVAIATPPPPAPPVLAATPMPPEPPPPAMTFRHPGESDFRRVESDPVSTFAADVDTATYTLARGYLSRGTLPPPESIRVEEIVNWLPVDYAPPASADFEVHGEMAPAPFGEGLHLLKIGIKAREVALADRAPLDLVFVVDVSGSMEQGGRLELVKRALVGLVNRLREDDSVAIVSFGSSARTVLRATSVRDSFPIVSAILSLAPLGSTNVAHGMQLGYALARSIRGEGRETRVILCSDGVANTGVVEADGILELATRGAAERIYLTGVGVGMGNHDDALLERLSDRGQGHYAYLDDDAEADDFMERLARSAPVVASDMKIQVEFEERAVSRYRLIGFENRALADEEFRDDAVDAGEIGAGHHVTALYEIETRPRFEGRPLLGTVRLRYRPSDGASSGLAPVREIEGRLVPRAVLRTFEATEPHFKLAVMAAEYGEILRGSRHAGGAMEDVAALFDRSFGGNAGASEICPGPEAAEFRELVGRAAALLRVRAKASGRGAARIPMSE